MANNYIVIYIHVRDTNNPPPPISENYMYCNQSDFSIRLLSCCTLLLTSAFNRFIVEMAKAYAFSEAPELAILTVQNGFIHVCAC